MVKIITKLGRIKLFIIHQSHIVIWRFQIFRWSTLEIETNEFEKDSHQAYAAGFLEGQLTKSAILLFALD